jgi:hypothetical protein
MYWALVGQASTSRLAARAEVWRIVVAWPCVPEELFYPA